MASSAASHKSWPQSAGPTAWLNNGLALGAASPAAAAAAAAACQTHEQQKKVALTVSVHSQATRIADTKQV